MTGAPGPRILLPTGPLVDGSTSLRPWRDTDLEAVVRACQDPELARWVSVPVPYSGADARLFLLSRYDSMFAGVTAPFAIVASGDGPVLGSISLMHFDWHHRRAEVGYWLAAEARGHGHATRALRLICGWALEALSLERIELRAATANPASQRVAQRAGFEREAVQRSYLRNRDGEPEDYVCFGLLADEP